MIKHRGALCWQKQAAQQISVHHCTQLSHHEELTFRFLDIDCQIHYMIVCLKKVKGRKGAKWNYIFGPKAGLGQGELATVQCGFI